MFCRSLRLYRRRRQNIRHPKRRQVICGSHVVVRSAAKYGDVADAGRTRAAAGKDVANFLLPKSDWTHFGFRKKWRLSALGAYATINIAFFYMAVQKWRGNVWMGGELPGNGWKWKWAMGLLNVGVLGMTVALLIAGYEQSFIERAVEGSTWSGYFSAQNHPWFQQAMHWRLLFGLITIAGLVLLIWDLVTIGKGESRPALSLSEAD
jgi:hypothetical protein